MIGDVEGHSIESCLVMGQMRSAVLAYVSEGHRPEAVLTRASNMLSHLESELLATCCVVYLDSVDGTAEVALAGHPAPLIRGPDGGIETLDTLIGVPLGVPSPVPYQPFEATLSAGTVLFLYTDGLSKTHGPDVVTDAGRMLASASQKADPAWRTSRTVSRPWCPPLPSAEMTSPFSSPTVRAQAHSTVPTGWRSKGTICAASKTPVSSSETA